MRQISSAKFSLQASGKPFLSNIRILFDYTDNAPELCWVKKNVMEEVIEPKIPGIDNAIQMEVKKKIICIRHQTVISDADVAELYGVETKRVNEAVRNNPDKFPPAYMYTLTSEELGDLRSKISTTKISSKSRARPKVFTEKGLYMLATILRSKTATNITFAIIETFAQVRYLKKEIVSLHNEIDKEKQTSSL